MKPLKIPLPMSGEVVGGRNLITHVTEVGGSVFMSPLTVILQTMRSVGVPLQSGTVVVQRNCVDARNGWIRGWKPLATFPNGITRCLRFYNRKAESYV